MPAIVELEGLTKRYGPSLVAVDALELSIEEGEFVTLLGPSGCGKTTTLRMIAGFEKPSAGTIRLAGEDVTDYPPYRRQVNTVFQDYALFPHMTIRDNVGYGLRVAGVERPEIARRVAEALEMIGLPDKAQARPGELSGGQKQRVALARALVRRPKVLLLDEPLSALDAKLRAAMQVELKHLHDQLGITFLFVTHDQTEALVMSDRIVVMEHGRIAQSGTPQDLYDRPASLYVADFIGVSNLVGGEVAAIDGDTVEVAGAGWRLRGARNGHAFAVGEKAVLAVRPEKVWPQDPGDPGSDPGDRGSDPGNLLRGTVIDCLFHGDSYRVQVDIGASAPFLVDVQLRTEASRATMPVPGSTLEMVVDPLSVNAFPASVAQ